MLEFFVKYFDLKHKAKCQFVFKLWQKIVDNEFRLYQNSLASYWQDVMAENQFYPVIRYNYLGPHLDNCDYETLTRLLSRFPNVKRIYIEKDVECFFKRANLKFIIDLYFICSKLESMYVMTPKEIVIYNQQLIENILWN